MSDALLQHQLNHAEYRVCQLNHENQKLREELAEVYLTLGLEVRGDVQEGKIRWRGVNTNQTQEN